MTGFEFRAFVEGFQCRAAPDGRADAGSPKTGSATRPRVADSKDAAVNGLTLSLTLYPCNEGLCPSRMSPHPKMGALNTGADE